MSYLHGALVLCGICGVLDYLTDSPIFPALAFSFFTAGLVMGLIEVLTRRPHQ